MNENETKTMASPARIACYLAPMLLALPVIAGGVETVDRVTAVGEQRIAEGQAAQETIDKLSEQSDALISQYKQVTKVIDGLKVYNSLLQKQVYNQTAEMTAMQTSIDDVSVIERQIVPLMVRMIGALDEFIALDVPFLLDERTGRIERLREMMERSDVEAAEKFRRVLEAYQIENDYGRTIEAYKGTHDVEGSMREVDFLRVGRVALLYQTGDREHSGAWNKAERRWQTLPPEQYAQDIAKGLKIARKQLAPDLLVLPIPIAEAVVP